MNLTEAFRLLRMPPTVTAYLLDQPESGMGFQKVRVTDKHWNQWRAIALNAELLVAETELTAITQAESYATLLDRAEDGDAIIESVEWIAREDPDALHEVLEILPKSPQATDAPEAGSPEGEIFRRFTPYMHDWRITSGGGLLPGTYATTEADSGLVFGCMDAIRRYALPVALSLFYRYRLEPSAGTVIRTGIAAPAFGQPGGGVEVLFKDGVRDSSITAMLRFAS